MTLPTRPPTTPSDGSGKPKWNEIMAPRRCGYVLCNDELASPDALLCAKHGDPAYRPTLEEAKEQVRQAEQVVRDRELAAEAEQKRKRAEASKAALRLIFDAIVSAINARVTETSQRVAVRESKGEDSYRTKPFYINLESGESCIVSIDVYEFYQSSGYRTAPTGKYQIKFQSDYTDRTQGAKTFPQKADGSFSYDKIAQTYLDRTVTRSARRAAADTAAQHREASAALITSWERPYSNAFRVEPSDTDGTKVKIEVHFKREMTLDEARTLLNELLVMGVVS